MDAYVFIVDMGADHKILIFCLSLFQKIHLIQNEFHGVVRVVFAKKEYISPQVNEARQNLIFWMHIIFEITDGSRIWHNNVLDYFVAHEILLLLKLVVFAVATLSQNIILWLLTPRRWLLLIFMIDIELVQLLTWLFSEAFLVPNLICLEDICVPFIIIIYYFLFVDPERLNDVVILLVVLNVFNRFDY